MKKSVEVFAVMFWTVCAGVFFNEVQRIVMLRLEHGEAFLAVAIAIIVVGLIAGVLLNAKSRA